MGLFFDSTPGFLSNAWQDPGDDDKKHHSFFGNLIHDVASVPGDIVSQGARLANDAGDVATGVGSFFGGIGKSIATDAIQAGKTVKNIGEGVYHDVTDPGKVNANDAMFRQATQDYHAGRITLAELNAKYKEFQDTGQQISQGITNEGINKDKATALQQGAATGNTFLNAATLGIAGGVKDLLFGAGKEVVAKATAEGGLKAGAKQATQTLFQTGTKEAATKEALTQAAQEGGTPAIRAAASHLADQFTANAGLGAGQGALQGAESNDPSQTFRDALLGGAAGGVLGGGTALLNKDVRSGLAEIPGKAGELIDNRTPLGQAGGVAPGGGNVGAHEAAQKLESQLPDGYKVTDDMHITDPTGKEVDPGQLQSLTQAPFLTAFENARNAGDTTTMKQIAAEHPDDARVHIDHSETPTQSSPAAIAHQAIVHDVASNYATPEDYVNDAAKTALSEAKSNSGGNLQRTEDGFIRTSTHTPFYRQFYAENKRAPNLGDFKQQIQTALENGTDGGGLVHPGEDDIYSLIKDRNDPGAALTEHPGADFETTRQQQIDALNGEGPDVAPKATPTVTEPLTGKERPRAVLKKIQESDVATPEVKQAVASISPQTYHDAVGNPETVAAAKAVVDADPQKALTDFLTKSDLMNHDDEALGYQLLTHAQANGDMSSVPAIAEKLASAGTAGGRAVQIHAIYNRLTPEGTLRYAARQLQKSREAISSTRPFSKGIGVEKDVAQEARDSVENVPVDLKDVKTAVRIAADETTTGEKVAKRVEKTVTPSVKKKADTLVDELTKKVKQEMLPVKAGAPKKSSIDVLREVFSRNGEAQEAYPEAQRILKEKFADNPKALEQLDKFFNTELGLPTASKTIDSAIKEQLVKNETKIAEIIHKSYSTQTQSIDDVATALTKEGFDADSAKKIATEVTSRLNEAVQNTKINTLSRLAREVPKRQLPTYLDKINKLSNLGALTDHDYLELARTKLDLPQLTPDIAKDVHDLSQKMQDMPPGYERDQIAHQIQERIGDAIPKTKQQIAAELISAPKSLMASFDLSGTLRQGGVLGSRFPSEAKQAFKNQVEYFSSQEKFDRGMSEIKQDPLFDAANRADVAMTGVDGSEEAFVSQLPEKIPLFGRGIQASDRAYTGGLTKLRFLAFKHIANDLRDEGIDINSFSDEQLKSIGKFINTASGRGYGAKNGLFEKVAPALNRTLFSPRLWKSRLDMLNPAYYYKLDPVAQKYAIQSAGSFASIAGVVLGLAAAAGAQVSMDPRSSDFLKIKAGDTRYDILGGFQQNLVFAARELSGQKVNSSTGAVTKLNDGSFGGATRLSVLSDLVQNKENPVISTGAELLNGQDNNGNPVNPKSELAKLLIPLNLQDTYTLAKNKDPLTALFGAAIPGSVGVGVNTYKANPPKVSSSSDTFGDFNKSLFGSK